MFCHILLVAEGSYSVHCFYILLPFIYFLQSLFKAVIYYFFELSFIISKFLLC